MVSSSESNLCILARIPVIRDFRLLGRSKFSGLTGTFYPPSSPEDWPKTISDIGDSSLREILVDWLYGPGAVGTRSTSCHGLVVTVVIVDGKAYMDDLPFWLSLVKSGETHRIVCGSAKIYSGADIYNSVGD